MPNQANEDGTGSDGAKRWELGLWAVLMGVAALLLGLGIIAGVWRDQTGLAALGVIASPVAAIISAYFGIQYSQKAAERAADARTEANTKVMAAQAREEQAKKDQGTMIETLRGEVLRKLEEAAKRSPMADDEAEGFAAKAWDEARAALPE